MASRVSHTTIDCHDAYALSTWWKEVVAYRDIAGDPNEPGDEECMIADPVTGHRLLFIEVPDSELPAKRIHLDLVPVGRTRDDEVDRLMQLGASAVDDQRRADGSGWVVLADPEGNAFCILPSDADRSAQTV